MVTPTSQGICSGSNITALIFTPTNGVAGTTFNWTRDMTSEATGIAASGSAFVSGSLSNTGGNTTVTFTVTPTGPSPSFCPGATFTGTVAVANLATLYSVTGGGNYCSPATAGAAVGLSNSQTGYSYQLQKDGSNSGASVAGSGAALDFGLQTVGTYTVIATASSCSRTMTGSVVVTSTSSLSPTISISTATTTVCSGSNTTFSATATNTGGSPSYAWKKNGSTVATTSSPSYVFVSNSLATNDVITCQLTSSNTCASPISVTSNGIQLTVNPSPAIAQIQDQNNAFVSSKTMCTLGSTLNIYCNTAGGTWSSSNGFASVVGAGGSHNTTGTVTANSAGIATVSYTLPPVNGCSSASSILINVAAVPTPNAVTGSATLCVGASTAYSTTSTSGVWSTTGRANINATTGLATGTSAGATSVKYTISNVSGCSAFSSLAITVNAQPAVPSLAYAPGGTNPTGPGGFCSNRTFGVVGSPASGIWSKTGVITATPTGVASTSCTISTGASAGPFSFTYTTTNANNCSNSRTYSSTVVLCGPRGVTASTIVSDNNFKMYPNPAKNNLNLQVDKLVGEGQVIVTNLLGKQVITQALSMGNNAVDISNLSKGFYLVSIITSEGKKTQKLIKE